MSPYSRIPVTDNHLLLPLRNEKYAPSKLLSAHTTLSALENFMECYNQLCFHYDIISPIERCKGLVGYCSDKMARKVESLPSYVEGDFDQLVQDLRYFLDKDDNASYNLGDIEEFTTSWRKQPIRDLSHFKEYHWTFLTLVGKAIGSKTIHKNEYNRYFWEGIHHTLRDKVEERLMLRDPDLDLSVPFEMNSVVQAVTTLFTKRRFDQHLRHKSRRRSDSDSEDNEYRPTRVHSETEEDREEDSDRPQDSRRRQYRRKPTPPPSPRPPLKQESSSPRKTERNEINELTQQMRDLKLLLSQKDAGYQGPTNNRRNPFPYNPAPQSHPSHFSNFPSYGHPPPPRRPPPFPSSSQPNPPRNNYPNPPPRSYVNAAHNNPQQRDEPPHMTQNSAPGTSSQNSYCYGCGYTGHLKSQCTELNTLLNQGTVVLDNHGRYCWPDGSYVSKDKSDSWVQAINKAIKRTNVVRTHLQDPEEEEEYQLIEVDRYESDASSDDQKELGWHSRHIADCYAVETVPRVSKEARRQIQDNIPNRPQRVEHLPLRSNPVRPRRQEPPIHQGKNLHRNQLGPVSGPTPIDVHKKEFEGKLDSQFLPMDIDESITEKPGNKGAKTSANQPRTNIVKSTNPGATADKISMEIVEDIMSRNITVPLAPLIDIAPSLRRGFLDAMKGSRVAARPIQDQKGKDEPVGRNVLGTKYENPSKPTESGRWETRDDLLTVSVRIGNVTMKGVFDSGSQANIISEEYAKLSGLPIQMKNLSRVKISGLDGGLAKCVGIIPNASIFVTESELETFGQLLVIQDAAFNLLLGRPWGTGNGGGIREAPEGTYLVFESHGTEYQINVSPSQSHRQRLQDLGTTMFVQRKEIEDQGQIVVGMVRSQLEVPDSEPERTSPEDDLEDANHLYDSLEAPEPGGNKPRIEVEEEELSGQAGGDFESEQEGAEEPALPTPGSICMATDNESDSWTSVVEMDLQENYIKWVQKGRSDEDWQKFCRMEKQRQRKEKSDWKKLKREREATIKKHIDYETPPPEESELSETLDSFPPSLRKRLRRTKPERSSAVAEERRSCRVRKASRRAEGSDYWRRNHQKTYERSDRRSRKAITSVNCEVPERLLSSFGAVVSRTRLGNGRGTSFLSQGNEEDKYSEPSERMEGADLQQPRHDQWQGTRSQEAGSFNIIFMRPESASRPDGQGWTIGPGDGSYNPEQAYPWISQEDMEELKTWVSRQHRSKGKHFYVHAIDHREIAITLAATEQEPTTILRKSDRTRIARMWHNPYLGWAGHPQHTVTCAWEATLGPEHRCSCGCEDGRAVPVFWIHSKGRPDQPHAIHKKRTSSNESFHEQGTSPPTPESQAEEPPESLDEQDEDGYPTFEPKEEPEDGRVTFWYRRYKERCRSPEPSGEPSGMSPHGEPDSIDPIRIIEQVPLPVNNGPVRGWRVGPGDHTLDPEKTYPWISREEAEAVAKWIQDLPGYERRDYYLHAWDEETLVVTVVNGSQGPSESLRGSADAQILQLWRNFCGDWIAIPKHALECAWGAVQLQEACVCGYNNGWSAPAFMITRQGCEFDPSDSESGESRIEEWTEDDERSDVKQVLAGRVMQPEDVDKEEPYDDEGLVVSKTEPEGGVIGTHLSTLPDPNDESEKSRRNPDFNDNEPTLSSWTHDDGRFEETSYRCGKSIYTRKDMARPGGEDRRVRRADEIPDKGFVLGIDGTYREEEEYPTLTADEIREIIEWTDNRPENRKGGKTFLFHQTARGTIAVTEVADRHNPQRQEQGVRVMELERNEQGVLQEVGKSRRDSSKESPTNFLRDPNPENRGCDVTRTEEDVTRSPTTMEEDGVPHLQVLMTRIRKTSGREEELNKELVTKESEVRDEEDLPEFQNLHLNPEPLTSEPRPITEDELARIMDLSFPVHTKAEYYSLPMSSNGGVFASRQIIPIARYDGQEDYKFLARQATLCWKEEGVTKYCRGDVLLRMTQRNPDPGPRMPSRKRVRTYCDNLLHNKTFGTPTSKQKRPGQTHQHWISRNVDTSVDLHGTDGEQGEDVPEGYGEEMSSTELEAVAEELMSDPMMKINERRAYEIIKNLEGRVIVTRIPHSSETVQELETEMDEIEARRGRVRKARNSDAIELTGNGNDPRTSDERLSGKVIETDKEFDGEERRPSNVQKLMEVEATQDTPAQRDVSVGNKDSIKKTPTEGEDSPLLNFHTPLSQSPAASPPSPPKASNCQKQMASQPPRSPTPPVFRTFAAVCSNPHQDSAAPQVVHPAAVQGQPLETDPGTGLHRPGIVAATHLIRVPPQVLTRPHHCFFGYGATVDVEEPHGGRRKFHGHVAVLLYMPPFPNTVSTPPPPPQDRVEAARVQLFPGRFTFRSPLATNPFLVSSSGNVPDYASPLETARMYPPPGLGRGRKSRDEEAEEGELEIAKVLVSIKHEDTDGKERLPSIQTILSQSKDPRQSRLPERPLQRKIEFVSGGFLQGTISEHSAENDQGKPRDVSKDTTSLNADSEHTKQSKDGPADDLMATDLELQNSPDVVPELLPPYEVDGKELALEEVIEKSKIDDSGNNLPDKTISAPSLAYDPLRSSPIPEEEPIVVSETTGVSYRVWKENLEKVERMLNNGVQWKHAEISDAFWEIQMYPWWATANLMLQKGADADWDLWKKTIVEQWTEKYEDALPMTFRWMANDLEQLLIRTQPMKVLIARKEKNQRGEDIDMEEADLPDTPSPTPDIVNNRAGSPTKPLEPFDKVPKRTYAELEYVRDVKNQVLELESRVTLTHTQLWSKIRGIENDITDGKVRTAEVQQSITELLERTSEEREQTREEEPMKEDEEEKDGWREVRRSKAARGRGRGYHGYRTRAAVANGYAPKDPFATPKTVSRELDDLKERAATLEKQVSGQEKEVGRLTREFGKVEALAQKIAELREAVDRIQTSQDQFRISISQDITRLTARLDHEVGPRLQAHDGYLTSLLSSYNMLAALANGLVAQPAPNVAPPPPVNHPKPVRVQNPNYRPTFLPHNVPPAYPPNIQIPKNALRTPANRKTITY